MGIESTELIQDIAVKGKIVGSRYKILEYLAEGGFGKTYLAEDTQLPGKDTCVVKQLYPSSGDPNFLAIARRLFATEASTLHSLGHHNQIPELLAYFEEEEKFYLVQQYIEGDTLGKHLNAGQIWSEFRVLELLQDGLKILQFVHQQGVIHRDVKPDNLILRHSDGKVVLVDFGTVKQVLQGQKTNIGQLTVPVGTQGYMPTEQARGKPRPSSDIYALGIICIQALTGIAPLELPEDEEGEIIWQPSVKISEGLVQILTKMTRYHFKDRYQSAQEVLEAIDQLSKVTTITKIKPATVVTPRSENDGSDQPAASSSLTNYREEERGTIETADYPVVEEASDIEPTQRIEVTEIAIPSEVYPVKKLNRQNNKAIAVAAIATLVGGLGIYLLLPSFQDQPETNPKTAPQNPTERVRQGEGFRRDL